MKRLIFLFILTTIALAQNSPKEIIRNITNKYRQIKTLEMKVKILTDVPNLRMPVKTVKLFYIHPDSVRMEAKGFAILPKNGALPFLYLNQLASDSVTFDTSYTKILKGREMLMFTLSDTSLMKQGKFIFSVDSYLDRIEKIELALNREIVSTFQFSYQNINGYWMPDTTHFEFHMTKRIPYASAPSITNPFGSVDIGSKEDHFQNEGNVRLIFSDYKINE